MAKTQGLTEQQFSAVKKTIEVGMQLQRDFPQIAGDFRSGMFAPEIIAKYDLTHKYGISGIIAEKAVYKAIRGHEGGFETASYSGLIEGGELERLVHTHRIRSGTRSGHLAYNRGLGIHKLTSEEKRKFARESGIKVSLAKGRVPYKDARPVRFAFTGMSQPEWFCIPEVVFAYELSQDLAYRKGRWANLTLIVQKLNELYHGGKSVRTNGSVMYALRDLKRSIKR